MSASMELRILRLFAEMQEEKIDLHLFRELVAGNDPKAKAEVVTTLDSMVTRGFLTADNDFYSLTAKGRHAAGL